jgi:hypothetical protein
MLIRPSLRGDRRQRSRDSDPTVNAYVVVLRPDEREALRDEEPYTATRWNPSIKLHRLNLVQLLRQKYLMREEPIS